MMGKLFLVRYPEKPIRIPDKGKTSIGRTDRNKIILDELRVSREHALIEWVKPEKVYKLFDLGSSNGTYLNGAKVPKDKGEKLKDWDKIRIASAIFTARIVDDEQTIMDEFKELRERSQNQMTQIFKVADIMSPEEQPAFAGDLAHLCPVEIFQMIESSNKSGILTLQTRQGQGEFAICDGQIVDASFGDKEGEQAVYETLRYLEGTFTFTPREIRLQNASVCMNTTFLLMEGCRLMDEAEILG